MRKAQKIMLNETKGSPKKKDYWGVSLVGICIVVLLLIGALVVLKAIQFGNTHDVRSFIEKVQAPVILQDPFPLREEKEWINPIVIVEEDNEPINVEELDDVEKVIYEVFGPVDYKFARAMAKAESGLAQERWNCNTNNTIDQGVFQINSIHLDKPECSYDKVTNMRGNIECAKFLFDTQGPQIWTVVKNGNAARDYE